MEGGRYPALMAPDDEAVAPMSQPAEEDDVFNFGGDMGSPAYF